MDIYPYLQQPRLWPIIRAIIWVAFTLGLTANLVWPVQANRALPSDLSYSTETTWLLPGLPHLSATAGTIPHNFSQNEIVFKNEAEVIHGFRSGKAYAQMSIQQLAWSMESISYYYPVEYLREPLEGYLRRQVAGPDSHNDLGAIAGPISSEGRSPKPLLTSDAETSLIHAAYLYYNMAYDTAWLQQEIEGRSVIERLNLAADWLYNQRLDPERQLLWRGPIIGWGGVDFSETTGNQVTELRLVSIEDQALAYMAFIELATMNAALGKTEQADQWQQRAERLKQAVNTQLWHPIGVYRPYTPLDSIEPVEPSARITIANALAVYSGLTNHQQSQTIFEHLERVRLEAEVKKPGLSLYPSYTAQEFSHTFAQPIIAAGNGPNGGLWDWWAGIQIKAEFLNGWAEMGQIHLLQVASEWQKHAGNIIEWQSTENSEQEGSHYHNAAAGTMGSAIIEGFFGLQLTGNGLSLQPRLGLNDGFIRVYQPATDHYAAYSYDWDQASLTLDYGTNLAAPVDVKILIRPTERIQQLLLDDHPIDFATEMIGQDRYITFLAPTGQHQIQVIKGDSSVDLSVTLPQSSPAIVTPIIQRPNIASNLTPRDEVLSATQHSLSLSPSDDPTSIASQNARTVWRGLLHFISTSWVILTSLMVILLVVLRRFSRFSLRIK